MMYWLVVFAVIFVAGIVFKGAEVLRRIRRRRPVQEFPSAHVVRSLRTKDPPRSPSQSSSL